MIQDGALIPQAPPGQPVQGQVDPQGQQAPGEMARPGQGESEAAAERAKSTRQRLVVELTELLLSNGVAGSVLSSRVIEALDTRIKTREEQRQKRVAISFSLAGLLGFGGISVILNSFVNSAVEDKGKLLQETLEKNMGSRFLTLESATDAATRKLVDDVGKTIKADVLGVIDDRVGREVSEQISSTTESILEREANLQKLSSLAVLLTRDSKGFSNSLRDSIAALLKRLSTDADIRSRPEFPSILEIVLDKFVAAGLDQHVDTIVGLFESECLGSSGIVETMITHYGHRLIGSGLPPEGVPVALVSRFESLVAAVNSHRLSSVLLPYRILWQFTLANDAACPAVENLLYEAEEQVDPKDKASILFRFIQYRRAAFWITEGEPLGIHMQRHCGQFWSEYLPALERIRDQPGVDRALESMAFESGAESEFRDAILEFARGRK